MDNFQYSVQLSDQDWAEFSATTDECGLLQAGLASGDELFSSDIDQGDSSGSSPPGPPPLLTGQLAAGGRGWEDCGEEARPEALLSLSLGTGPPDQCSSFPGSVDPSDMMQRLLQGPSPSSSGNPPVSSNSPGHSANPQKPSDRPETPPRSPGRKKRHAVGGKGGRHLATPVAAGAPPGSLKLPKTMPEEGLGLAGAKEKGFGAGTAKTMGGAQQYKPQPDSGDVLATLVPLTEQGTDQVRMTPRAELHGASVLVQEDHPDALVAEPREALSSSSLKLQPDVVLPTTSSSPQPTVALSKPSSTATRHVDLPKAGPVAKPKVDSPLSVSVAVPSRDLPHSSSKTESDMVASTPAPGDEAAAPTQHPVLQMRADTLETQMTTPPRRHQEKPGGASGHASGEFSPGPAQIPKKKKVRFSMAAPSPKEPGSGEATGPPSSASAWSSAPGMAVGGREGSATWDAVAVGPRSPKPRILKHLPPPAPSASAGTGAGNCFAVTLPEAYEFFFCDTIEEEEEVEEDSEEAAASQELGHVQWPDICEFFFQDSCTQRSGCQGSCSPTPPPGAEPVLAAPPGDPLPFSIPEAYEHFLGEDRFGGEVSPTPLLQLQTSEPPRNVGTRSPPEPVLAIPEQLSLAAKQAVLLANLGTISAIRYFRRQVNRGRSPSSSPSLSPSRGPSSSSSS